MRQPNRLAPVIYSTATITLLAVLPFVNLLQFVCCANAILGGVIAANIYNKELANTGINIEFKDGMIMGVLSGVLSSIIVTGINIIILLFSNINPIGEVNIMLEQMNQPVTPEMNEILQYFSDEFSKYGFSPTMSIIQLIGSMVLYSAFASIGAAIAISMIRKKRNTDSFPVN